MVGWQAGILQAGHMPQCMQQQPQQAPPAPCMKKCGCIGHVMVVAERMNDDGLVLAPSGMSGARTRPTAPHKRPRSLSPFSKLAAAER